jgi:hypothetical protein
MVEHPGNDLDEKPGPTGRQEGAAHPPTGGGVALFLLRTLRLFSRDDYLRLLDRKAQAGVLRAYEKRRA